MTRNLYSLRVQTAHAVTYATVTLMLAGPARTAGSSMPWEAPLQSILESIEGQPVNLSNILPVPSNPENQVRDNRMPNFIDARL